MDDNSQRDDAFRKSPRVPNPSSQADDGVGHASGCVAVSRGPQSTATAGKADGRPPQASNACVPKDRVSERELLSVRNELDARNEEVRRLKGEVVLLKASLRKLRQKDRRQPSSEANALEGPAAPNVPTEDDAIILSQLTMQMNTLMSQKSHLSQENDRLSRENGQLHELLDFMMQRSRELAPEVRNERQGVLGERQQEYVYHTPEKRTLNIHDV